MGNRGVITTDASLKELGIYLHWNGGRDSVEGFLAYCKMKGYGSPERDFAGWAYLAGVISNYFGDGLCTGMDVAATLDCDNWDNGVYLVKDWLIWGRKFRRGSEQLQYDLRDMLEIIDEKQPKRMRLKPEEWAKFPEVEAAVLEAREKCIDVDDVISGMPED